MSLCERAVGPHGRSMTAETAISEALKLLEQLDIRNWDVVVEDLGPRNELTGLRTFGTARMLRKQIVISSRWLDDDAETRRTIDHEIAHALLAEHHGVMFNYALEQVQKLKHGGTEQAI